MLRLSYVFRIIIAIFAAFASASAFAGPWDSSRYQSRLQLELGPSYLTHYTFATTRPSLRSPSNAYLLEAHMNVWVSKRLAGYAVYGKSVGPSSAQILAGGGMFMLFVLRNFSRAFIAADIVRYAPGDPVPPDTYDAVSYAPRLGGSTQVTLGNMTYVNVQVMGTRLSNNFMVMMYVGLGLDL